MSNTNTILSNSNNTSDVPLGHGHFFTKKTFHKPTYCHHCTEMLWGLIGQGFICEGLFLFLSYFPLYFSIFNFALKKKFVILYATKSVKNGWYHHVQA